MNLLSSEQQLSLVEIIKTESSTTLSFEEFTDVLLELLEDVAGFETRSEQAVITVSKQLWSKYHE